MNGGVDEVNVVGIVRALEGRVPRFGRRFDREESRRGLFIQGLSLANFQVGICLIVRRRVMGVVTAVLTAPLEGLHVRVKRARPLDGLFHVVVGKGVSDALSAGMMRGSY